MHGWSTEIDLYSIQERRQSVAWLMKYEDSIQQEDETKWEGPFIIAEVLGPVTYRLQLPSSWQIHNVFHTTLLQPYKENNIYGSNFPEPPTELENKEEVYEVDSIINHRKQGRGYQYYMKWKGYPISEASWKPEQAFSDNGNMLTLYKNRHWLWNIAKKRWNQFSKRFLQISSLSKTT